MQPLIVNIHQAESLPVEASPVGRFAPSPTGSLHFGSLVAAVGSWLFARAEAGTWLVRIEDIDTTRVVPGSAEEILRTLERYALHSDREPVWQSERIVSYERALASLEERELAYGCACSRAELARAAEQTSEPGGEPACTDHRQRGDRGQHDVGTGCADRPWDHEHRGDGVGEEPADAGVAQQQIGDPPEVLP